MKTKLLMLLAACFLLAGLVVSPLLITGCQTVPTSAKARAFLSMKDTWTTVKGAMRYYAAECQQGKVSVEKQAQIDAAYLKFHAAFTTAQVFKDEAKYPQRIKPLRVFLLATIAPVRNFG